MHLLYGSLYGALYGTLQHTASVADYVVLYNTHTLVHSLVRSLSLSLSLYVCNICMSALYIHEDRHSCKQQLMLLMMRQSSLFLFPIAHSSVQVFVLGISNQ